MSYLFGVLKNLSYYHLYCNYELKMYCVGVLYHRWKKYDKAERLYKQALEINPHIQSAKDNMALLNKARNRIANQQ
jgi:tetratricopeptide (TPR) repeat protein